MKYKALVTDFDLTLTNSQGFVDKETVEKVNNFIKNGGKFAVCTGRMLHSIKAVLLKNGICCHMASFDGCQIVTKEGEEIYKSFLNNKLCVEILKLLEQTDLYFQCYSDKIIVPYATDYTYVYAKTSSTTIIETNGKLSKYFEENGEESGKILVRDDPKKIDFYFDFIKDGLKGKAEVIRSSLEMIDILALNNGKDVGVKKLAEYWGVSTKDIIVMGDNGNDESMLKIAGLPIAVSNATNSVKDLCEEITLSCDENPVALIIDKYLK